MEQFVRFYESGELGGETDHFELLDGEILQKLGQNEPHVSCIRLSTKALRRVFGEGFDVSQQLPITLSERDRPEPDITVLRGDAADFEGRLPAREDVELLVEIVDSRMDTPRGQKVPIYARAGIHEYWIVDLRRRVVEVRREPLPEAAEWAETRICGEGESITLNSVGHTILVRDLLPRMAHVPEEP